MKNFDLGDKKSTISDEVLFLKILADYNVNLSSLYNTVSSCRVQRIINEEFSRVYELTKEIIHD